MARLRALFDELGFAGVSTFIASGNVLFTRGVDAQAEAEAEADYDTEARIEAHLHSALGFEVATMLRTASDVEAVAAFTPFPDLDESNHSHYVGFLRTTPGAAEVERVMSRTTPADTVRIHGRELYWAVAGRSSDSKLTGNVLERCLGMPLTLRNRNTVRKMAVLLSVPRVAADPESVPGKARKTRRQT